MRSSVTVNVIKTWEQYFFENERTMPSTARGLLPVDNEINRKVSLWQGDITRLRVDAIVNAAKKSLDGGGGVDGAIHAAAGPGLKRDSKSLGPIRTGTAVITGGHNLPARYVIHTVGPKNKDPVKLQSAYESSLNFATTYALRTIAFPSISTGVYGFPPHEAAPIACSVVRNFLERNKNRIDRIIFVVFGYDDRRNYENAMNIYFPVGLSHTCPTMRATSARPRLTRDDKSAALASGRFAVPSASVSSILSRTSFGSGIEIPTASARRPTTVGGRSSARRSASPASAYTVRSRRPTTTSRRITSAITSPSSLGSLGAIPSAYSALSGRLLTRIPSSSRMSSIPSAYSGRRLTSPTRIASSRRMTPFCPITSTLRTISASSFGSLGSHGSIRRRMMLSSGTTRPRILRTMTRTLLW